VTALSSKLRNLSVGVHANMKNLVAVTLFVAMLASAQTPNVEPGLLLTEVETLQISIVMKDTLLAAQRMEILLTRYNQAVVERNAGQAAFDQMVVRLRAVHEAPADRFTFDSATLRFIPLPPEEPKL